VRSDAQNIGFAIPIGTALRIAAELKRYGKVRRPWTGLITMDVSRRSRSGWGFPNGGRGRAGRVP
jgi:S1-C subfamily serine protease